MSPLANGGTAPITKVTRWAARDLVEDELVPGCGCRPARAVLWPILRIRRHGNRLRRQHRTTTISVQADSIAPVVTFAPLTDGETVTDLSAIGGNVTDNFGLVASVMFSIHELDINYGPGRWWNGTNFQSDSVALPATVSGTNWSPAAGVALAGAEFRSELRADRHGHGHEQQQRLDTTSRFRLPITVLGWDPGQTPLGTAVLRSPNTNGGNYWFKIITAKSERRGLAHRAERARGRGRRLYEPGLAAKHLQWEFRLGPDRF